MNENNQMASVNILCRRNQLAIPLCAAISFRIGCPMMLIASVFFMYACGNWVCDETARLKPVPTDQIKPFKMKYASKQALLTIGIFSVVKKRDCEAFVAHTLISVDSSPVSGINEALIFDETGIFAWYIQQDDIYVRKSEGRNAYRIATNHIYPNLAPRKIWLALELQLENGDTILVRTDATTPVIPE